MTNLEFCIERRHAERPAFLRVLKALPKDKLDYRPHPHSRTAAEIAWVITSEESDLAILLDKGAIDWKEDKPPADVDFAAVYERNAVKVDELLRTLNDATWQKKGAFMMGGKPVWEDTLGGFAWGFLFDAVHHRGQLSTYIRPMGGKVPSIYGPSGDDSGRT
jgi:uncharacterized damage-inducible protein DinB